MQNTVLYKIAKWFVILVLTLLLMIALQVSVFADDVVLTVDTSLNVQNQNSDETATVPETTPEPWVWHPISVIHDEINGFHTIRKTYALPADVNPVVIPTDDILMFGQPFTFGYMVQQPTANESYREVRQTVTIETATAMLNDVLPNLDTEMRFERDGYAGILSLDVQSIRSESAGTASRNATVTRRRTYPHLSHQDNSLIPTTINEGGITLYLSNVEWVANNTTAIDGLPVASTFSAHATYTTSITQTTTIGYVTTADYTGVISRTVQGKTLYTVVFIGTKVVDLSIPGVEQGAIGDNSESYGSDITGTGSIDASAGINTGSAGVNANVNDTKDATHPPREAAERNLGPFIRIIGALILLALVAASGYFLVKGFLNNSVSVFSIHGPREIVKAGKVKINVDVSEATIVLDSIVGSHPSKTGRYLIQIAGRTMPKIANKDIRVILHDSEANHHMPEGTPHNSFYEFEVNFSDED